VRDAHPRYITWDQFEEHQTMLRENAAVNGQDRRLSPPVNGQRPNHERSAAWIWVDAREWELTLRTRSQILREEEAHKNKLCVRSRM
jgi:hypothetical protein